MTLPDNKLLTSLWTIFLCFKTLDKRPNQRYNNLNNQLIIQFIVRRKPHEKGWKWPQHYALNRECTSILVHSLCILWTKPAKKAVHKVHTLPKLFSENAQKIIDLTHIFMIWPTKSENRHLPQARWGGRGRKFKSCHSDHAECPYRVW